MSAKVVLGWLLLKVMTLSSGGLKGGGGFGAQCVSPKKTSTLRQRKGRASPTIHHMILSCDNVMPGRGVSHWGGCGVVVVGVLHDDDDSIRPLDFVALGPKNPVWSPNSFGWVFFHAQSP